MKKRRLSEIGRKRLGELVRYVCARCRRLPALSMTRLNTALWYVDATSFRLWGYTISGEASYVKWQHGPAPKKIMPVLERLERSGHLAARWATHYGYRKREFLSLESPDAPHFKKMFSERERSVIDGIVDNVTRGHAATWDDDVSHEAIWNVAELGEDIPVFAVLAAFDAPVTPADKRLCKDAVEKWMAAA